MSIGGLVLHRNQIELILEELAYDFDSIVDAINSKSEFISLDELESLLLNQEARVEKSKKDVVEMMSVNLTQGNAQNSNLSPQNLEIKNSNGDNFQGYGRGNNSLGRGNRGGRFRGRGGRNGYRNFVQC